MTGYACLRRASWARPCARVLVCPPTVLWLAAAAACSMATYLFDVLHAMDRWCCLTNIDM
jgi:hypothetical protein